VFEIIFPNLIWEFFLERIRSTERVSTVSSPNMMIHDTISHVLPSIEHKLRCRTVCRVWNKQIQSFPVESLVFVSDQSYHTVPFRRRSESHVYTTVSSVLEARIKSKASRKISNIVKRIQFLGFRGKPDILRVLVEESQLRFPETKRFSVSHCDAKDLDWNFASRIEFIGCDKITLPKACIHLCIDQSNVTMQDLRSVYHNKMKSVSARFTPVLRTFMLSLFPEYDIYMRRIKTTRLLRQDHDESISFNDVVDVVVTKIRERRDKFSELETLLWRSKYECFRDEKSAARELILDCHSAVVFPPPSHYLTTYQRFLGLKEVCERARDDIDPLAIVTAHGTSRPHSLVCAVESFDVSVVSFILAKGGNPQYSLVSSEDSLVSLIIASARDGGTDELILQKNSVRILSLLLSYVRIPHRRFRLGWTYVHFVAQENWIGMRRERLGLKLLCMFLDDVSVPPGVQDFDGTTALMVAAIARNIEIVSELSSRMSGPELLLTDNSGTFFGGVRLSFHGTH